MDEIMSFRSQTPLLGSRSGASTLMQNHVQFYESASISDLHVSKSLTFIVNHMSARLNERVHSLMRHYHPRLLGTIFQSTSGSDMEFKHGITEVKPSFYGVNDHLTGISMAWTQRHQAQCHQVHLRTMRIKPRNQVCGDQLHVISVKKLSRQ